MLIKKQICELVKIVESLRRKYNKFNKSFALDGRLVGDIGEVLVAESYDIELFDKIKKNYDGKTSKGQLVQIKATMKNSLTFPADHVPKYYLGIKIMTNGDYKVIYNGPGKNIKKLIKDRKTPKTNLHSVSISSLSKLNEGVLEEERIPLRNK